MDCLHQIPRHSSRCSRTEWSARTKLGSPQAATASQTCHHTCERRSLGFSGRSARSRGKEKRNELVGAKRGRRTRGIEPSPSCPLQTRKRTRQDTREGETRAAPRVASHDAPSADPGRLAFSKKSAAAAPSLLLKSNARRPKWTSPGEGRGEGTAVRDAEKGAAEETRMEQEGKAVVILDAFTFLYLYFSFLLLSQPSSENRVGPAPSTAGDSLFCTLSRLGS